MKNKRTPIDQSMTKLTAGFGDLDLEGDLQKVQKQPNLISTSPSIKL